MSLPLVITPSELANHIDLPRPDDSTASASQTAAGPGQLRLVDLRSADEYAAGHIPGAVHGDASLLNRADAPIGGLMPEPEAVNTFLRAIGANLGDSIVAYDGGRATPAARLMWVLDAYGYGVGSWLSGGFSAWQAAGLAVSTTTESAIAGDLNVSFFGDNVISADALMGELGKPTLKILDVRSEAEYTGTDVRSAQGGHVPGARHLEWTRMLDDTGQLIDDDTLQQQLNEANVKTSDTVIVYCQTHQRSAVTYVALKHLGYEDVRALDGAWSNWGNRSDTPKES